MTLFSLTTILFFLSLTWRYYDYRRLVEHPKRFFKAEVLLHYTKRRNGKIYDVLKLQSDGLVFYTATAVVGESLRGKTVVFLGFTDRIGFLDFLQTPYIPGRLLRVEPTVSYRTRLYRLIATQHAHPWAAELYGALFLALPVSGELRERISLLGVNHLLALSGFHLGLLWAVLYTLLATVYRPLQNRWFPWRHRLFDLGAATLALLGGYVVLVGGPPSLLRAYTMAVVGWVMTLFGVRLVSPAFLAFCVLLLLALAPSLLFSIGFWFSVAGVYFVFLFLEMFKKRPAWQAAVALNVGLFAAMAPVVHAFFGRFCLWQLLSPLLSLLFVPFYPLAVLSHLFGVGDWLDEGILWLLERPDMAATVDYDTPLWFLVFYLTVALLAWRWRFARWLWLGSAWLFIAVLVQKVA